MGFHERNRAPLRRDRADEIVLEERVMHILGALGVYPHGEVRRRCVKPSPPHARVVGPLLNLPFCVCNMSVTTCRRT